MPGREREKEAEPVLSIIQKLIRTNQKPSTQSQSPQRERERKATPSTHVHIVQWLITTKTTFRYLLLNTLVFCRNISQMKPKETPWYILYFATNAYKDKIIIYFSSW